MKPLKASELEGAALDYWMLRAMGDTDFEGISFEDFTAGWTTGFFCGWAEIGPLIEREQISLLRPDAGHTQPWLASGYGHPYVGRPDIQQFGPTPLVAVMRCYIASKFREDLPQHLPDRPEQHQPAEGDQG